MTAAVVAVGRVLATGANGIQLQTRPDRELCEGHVRLAMRLGGICRTDLYVASGELPVAPGRVLGHEACAVVLESRDAALREGTRVVVNPLLACGSCVACQDGDRCGQPQLLGVHHDGLFAEQVQLASAHVLAVPATLDDAHAAFVEPVAAALAVNQASLPLSQPGAVIGRGRIATLVLRILRSLGAADVQLLSADSTVRDGRYHWCVETVASSSALATAFAVVRPGGTVVWKSRPQYPVLVDLARAVRKRLRIVAVDYAPFADAIAWLAEHPQHDLLAVPLPWANYPEAFARAGRDEDMKIMLDITGATAA